MKLKPGDVVVDKRDGKIAVVVARFAHLNFVIADDGDNAGYVILWEKYLYKIGVI